MGDQGKTMNHLPRWTFPMFVKSGNGKDVDMLKLNAEWNFAFRSLLPFIISIEGHYTSSFVKGLAKGGFFIDAFDPGIDQLVPDLDVFGPVRDQAPAIEMDDTQLILRDDRMHMRGGDVVIG